MFFPFLARGILGWCVAVSGASGKYIFELSNRICQFFKSISKDWAEQCSACIPKGGSCQLAATVA